LFKKVLSSGNGYICVCIRGRVRISRSTNDCNRLGWLERFTQRMAGNGCVHRGEAPYGGDEREVVPTIQPLAADADSLCQNNAQKSDDCCRADAVWPTDDLLLTRSLRTETPSRANSIRTDGRTDIAFQTKERSRVDDSARAVDHLRAGSILSHEDELFSGLRGMKSHFVLFLIFFLLILILVELLLTFLLISALNLTPTAGFTAFMLGDDAIGSSHIISFPHPVKSDRVRILGSGSSSSRGLSHSSPAVLSFSREPLTFSGNGTVDLRVDSRKVVKEEEEGELRCEGARWRINGSVDGLHHHLVANKFSWSSNDGKSQRSFCLGNCDGERRGAFFRLPSSSSSLSSIASASMSKMTTSRITSVLDEPLELSSGSDGAVFIRGNEGVSIDAGAFLRLETRRKNADIFFSVKRSSPETRFVGGKLKLKAENIFVGSRTVDSGRRNVSSRTTSARSYEPPSSASWSSITSRSSSSSYPPFPRPHTSYKGGFKICVCSNNRLFRVAIGTDGGFDSSPRGCFNLSKKNNPCLSLKT